MQVSAGSSLLDILSIADGTGLQTSALRNEVSALEGTAKGTALLDFNAALQAALTPATAKKAPFSIRLTDSVSQGEPLSSSSAVAAPTASDVPANRDVESFPSGDQQQPNGIEQNKARDPLAGRTASQTWFAGETASIIAEEPMPVTSPSASSGTGSQEEGDFFPPAPRTRNKEIPKSLFDSWNAGLTVPPVVPLPPVSLTLLPESLAATAGEKIPETQGAVRESAEGVSTDSASVRGFSSLDSPLSRFSMLDHPHRSVPQFNSWLTTALADETTSPTGSTEAPLLQAAAPSAQAEGTSVQSDPPPSILQQAVPTPSAPALVTSNETLSSAIASMDSNLTSQSDSTAHAPQSGVEVAVSRGVVNEGKAPARSVISRTDNRESLLAEEGASSREIEAREQRPQTPVQTELSPVELQLPVTSVAFAVDDGFQNPQPSGAVTTISTPSLRQQGSAVETAGHETNSFVLDSVFNAAITVSPKASLQQLNQASDEFLPADDIRPGRTSSTRKSESENLVGAGLVEGQQAGWDGIIAEAPTLAMDRKTVDQIVTHTLAESRLVEHGGSQRFQIRLDPPDLGGLTIEIHRHSTGQVSVSMTTASPETHSLLEKKTHEIAQALQDQGLPLSQFDLSHQQHQGQTFEQRTQYQDQLENLRLVREAREQFPASGTPASAPLPDRFSFRA